MHEGKISEVTRCSMCVLLLGLVGCAFAESDPDVVGRTAAIIGADEEDVVPPYNFPAVVRVPNCTGTLISPSHVLTAAHCVSDGEPRQVEFVARDTDATADNTFTVAACAMNPDFTRANVDLVRPEFRVGTTAEILDGVGDRCGVLMLRGTLGSSSDTPFDFAVLTLERPIPHPVDDPTTIGAGVVFVAPEHVVDAPAVSSEPFSAAAVGFGGVVAMTSTDSGIRRVKRFSTSIISGAVTRAGVLGEQDSGGPLFMEDAGDRAVVGVASTALTWAVFDDAYNLAWVRQKVDTDSDGRADVLCPRGLEGSDPTAVAANDRDGDGVLDADDTCPNTYNPCQEATDIDGDGIPDDCDACPADDTVTAFRGDGTLPDTDADGVADACDCHTTTYDPPSDTDHDFVRSTCDNCPRVFNPFQENADGDSFGDACDRCPATADTGLDVDGDSVPDACDDCVRAYDPDQANCNADAEIADGLLVLDPVTGTPVGPYGVGDACDPIPCADTTFANGTSVVDRGGITFRGIGTQSVLVDGLATDPFDGRTGFRMCRCSAATSDDIRLRIQCKTPLLDGTGGCAVNDTAAYDAPLESPTWRLLSLSFGDANGDGVVDLEDARAEPVVAYGPPATGFETDLALGWDLDADLDRWSVVFGDTFPGDGFGNRRPVPGTVWTRTVGPASGANFAPGSDEAALAHHYTSGLVTPPVEARAPFPALSFIVPFLPIPALCPLCADTFPGPWLAFPGSVPVPFEPPTIAFADTYLDADESFAADPTTLFDGTGTWIAASEPARWLPKDGLRYVNVLDDGSLARVLVDTPFGLAEPGTKPPPPPCDNPAGCGPFLAAMSSATMASRGPVLVLSARRQTLFAVELGRLVIRDLNAETTRVANHPDRPLGDVLAATYDPANDVLVVLDEVAPVFGRGRTRERGVRLIRLLLVDPGSGAVDVVTEFHRVGGASRYALAPEPGGGLWLAASAERGPHIAVLLEGPWWNLRERGFAVGQGALASTQARADRRGLTLAVEDRGRAHVVGHAVEGLVGRDHRNIDRCF